MYPDFNQVALKQSGATAIGRRGLSAPMRRLKQQAFEPFLGTYQHVDIGCGRGKDAAVLGIAGWDPVHNPHPEGLRASYKVGTMIYVLNTLPEDERRKAVDYAFSKFNLERLYVVVRDDVPEDSETQWEVWFGDEWRKDYKILFNTDLSLPGRFRTYIFTRQ